MGCEVSHLDKEVCLRNETPEMHSAFIDQHGLSRYYEVMGMTDPEAKAPEMDDNSNNINVGLINLEEKSATSYEFYGIRWTDLLEIALGILAIIYVAKIIYNYIKKKRQVAKLNKNLELKELVQEASAPQGPAPPAYSQPQTRQLPQGLCQSPMDFAIQAMHDSNTRAVVPVFSNTLYD